MKKLVNIKSFLSNTLWVLCLLVISCGKEEFKTNPNSKNFQTNDTVSDTALVCSDFTLVKPQVDFLFLWDNSASQYFVTPAAKAALNNIINQVSKRFDYRAVIAPLIVDNYSLSKVNDEAFLIAENIADIKGNPLKIKPQSDAQNLLNFKTIGGSREQGLIRAYDLVDQNINNGVFRKDSYTMIVLMSNGNENSYIPEGRADTGGASFFAKQKSKFIFLRDTRLRALQFRFMSVVAHSTCGGFKRGQHYIEMSRALYQTSYLSGKPSPIDQGDDPTPDSYDICNNEFSSIFEKINTSIEPQLLKHIYNYWPITSNTRASASIDLSKIEVTKMLGSSVIATIPKNSVNGWQYVGSKSNQNTRIQPTPGEPFTGLMLKLNGTAKVTYPQCLKVKTQTPADYYGFVHLHSNPALNTIYLKINGQTISQSTTNGWQFIGHLSNHNIKIIGPTNTNENTAFPEFKTGYFLKINGQSLLQQYTNGATVSITYTPAAN